MHRLSDLCPYNYAVMSALHVIKEVPFLQFWLLLFNSELFSYYLFLHVPPLILACDNNCEWYFIEQFVLI